MIPQFVRYFGLLLLLCSFAAKLSGQVITFADPELERYLIYEKCVDLDQNGFADIDVDTNDNLLIELSEALAVDNLLIMDVPDAYVIRDVEDLRHFSNLKKLSLLVLDSLNRIQGLGLDSLTHFQIDGSNYLDVLDLSDMPGLLSIRIEGCMDMAYLNLQNGTEATEMFSLFYSENIRYACVDSIFSEYDMVNWHMDTGLSPSLNCLTSSESAGPQLSQQQSLVLYPQPAFQEIHLELQIPASEIQLLDLQGRTWRRWGPKGRSTVLELEGCPPGVYFLRVLQEGTWSTSKFIKASAE